MVAGTAGLGPYEVVDPTVLGDRKRRRTVRPLEDGELGQCEEVHLAGSEAGSAHYVGRRLEGEGDGETLEKLAIVFQLAFVDGRHVRWYSLHLLVLVPDQGSEKVAGWADVGTCDAMGTGID